jgi:hypothetical protein
MSLRADHNRRPRRSQIIPFADPFESIAKKLAVRAKRLHV